MCSEAVRRLSRRLARLGVARARDLGNRRKLGTETIERMVSCFTRHAVDKLAEIAGRDERRRA